MEKIFIILALCAAAISIGPKCPIKASQGSFQSDTIIVGIEQAIVSLNQTKNTLCYQQTLNQQFNSKPNIAISLNGFDAQSIDSLFFSIKPLKFSSSTTLISFMIRTLWKETKWNKISFSFLASDKADIDLGYYQVDSGELACCNKQKHLVSFIPLNKPLNYNFTTQVFLHGFEMQSYKNTQQNTYSDYQIEILRSTPAKTGILIQLRINSSTSIHSIFISFIAYKSDDIIASSTYENTNIVSNLFSTEILKSEKSLLQAFHGLNSFRFTNKKQKTVFKTNFNTTHLLFYNDGNSLLSIKYSYILIFGYPCQYCPQYPILYGNNCIKQCPQGLYRNGSTCIKCNQKQIWNGQMCIPQCLNGQKYNINTKTCQCPNGYHWNKQSCIICIEGQIWNQQTNKCECKNGTYWNQQKCVSCQPGLIWNNYNKNCTCPEGQFWTGFKCIKCPYSQIWNQNLKLCQCPKNKFWNGKICIECLGGQIWNNQILSCQCPPGQIWINGKCEKLKCKQGQFWNGNACISLCINGSYWNPNTKKCICENGKQFNGFFCQPNCKAGQNYVNGKCVCSFGSYWTGNQCKKCQNGESSDGLVCIKIQCPPGKFWNGKSCDQITRQCPFNFYFDGHECKKIEIKCPTGTEWNGTLCVSKSKCPQSTYEAGSQCLPIPTPCPITANWNGKQCTPINFKCPSGSFFNGRICIPYISCQNGKIWNIQLSQCICPEGSFWNSNKCVQCGGGRSFIDEKCQCPQGKIWNNSKCQIIDDQTCHSIKNSFWKNQKCICKLGYEILNSQCICKGLQMPDMCDLCYKKPFSIYKQGLCLCLNGYIEINGSCIQKGINQGNDTKSICSIATYFDQQQRRCLPCSDGCLSCQNCYFCEQCRPQFTYNHKLSSCSEICGDGKRFTLECDDGNNDDGDGCSKDCFIQEGFNCFQGSPSHQDICTELKPQKIKIRMTGQTHLYGKIIINVQLDYLPRNLTNPSECIRQCPHILDVKIVQGYKSYLSIKTAYIPSTSFSFSIEIQFGKQPIGIFKTEVSINKSMKKYFNQIDISDIEMININPAFLALYEDRHADILI